MTTNQIINRSALTSAYNVGDRDERSWGWYEVINVGRENDEDFCDKKISVYARQALSLQRHRYRREIWDVVDGSLTVIIDGTVVNVSAGERIEIPCGAPHCMINLSRKPALLYERQTVICREEDNDRLSDYSGRPTVSISADDVVAMESVKIYESITKLL